MPSPGFLKTSEVAGNSIGFEKNSQVVKGLPLVLVDDDMGIGQDKTVTADDGTGTLAHFALARFKPGDQYNGPGRFAVNFPGIEIFSCSRNRDH